MTGRKRANGAMPPVCKWMNNLRARSTERQTPAVNGVKCFECGGSHEPSGARSDCIRHWKRRAIEAENALLVKKVYGENHWNTSEPPKDGKTIIVVGRIIWTDEYSTCADSFVAAVRWIKDQSNYEGWHYDRDGMTVARTLDDEVKVDWWADFPKEARP